MRTFLPQHKANADETGYSHSGVFVELDHRAKRLMPDKIVFCLPDLLYELPQGGEVFR